MTDEPKTDAPVLTVEQEVEEASWEEYVTKFNDECRAKEITFTLTNRPVSPSGLAVSVLLKRVYDIEKKLRDLEVDRSLIM